MTDYSELYRFDNISLRSGVSAPDRPSRVEYDEYVVYRMVGSLGQDALQQSTTNSEKRITYKISQDEMPGHERPDLAFCCGYLVRSDGVFGAPPAHDRSHIMEGRIRRVVCYRHSRSLDPTEDGLTLSAEHSDILGLHPATLQYVRRVTTESRFWSADQSKLSVILSFLSNPKTPFDFLSMTYDVAERCSTVLVRQSYQPRRHRLENLDEYDERLDSCLSHWTHPFIIPIGMLQVQFSRTEEAIAENIGHVFALEWEVNNIAGFDALDAEHKRRTRPGWRSTTTKGSAEKDHAFGPLGMTNLMKSAHDTLKESIELLDTVLWIERVVQMMLQAGDELASRIGTREVEQRPNVPHPNVPVNGPTASTPERREDFLGCHCQEIRQYLEALQGVYVSLETDGRMSEARCRAQIDMIYSKMAQEDNILNARMAVSSSRDSSSMKALAVITAIFLPGEFLASFFGMAFFELLQDSDDGGATAAQADLTSRKPVPVLSNLLWVYWATVIPLTIGILCLWRVWWVNEDRYFRRHLSKELSEEKFWTPNGKPRHLERSFFRDFLHLWARGEEKAGQSDSHTFTSTQHDAPALSREGTSFRRRQILVARRESIRQRGSAVAV